MFPDLSTGRLLTMDALSFEAEHALEQSLVDYEDGTADFAECLHVALARKSGAMPFWTFDRKAAKTIGTKVLV